MLLIINISVYAQGQTFSRFCPETSTCRFDTWGDIFIYFLASFFYILPLLFNMISYSAIIRQLRNRRPSSRNLLISLRAILVCVVFTMSWVPHFTFHVTHLADQHFMWVCQVFMYLNAITDPLLYVFSPNAIKPCINKIRVKRGFTLKTSGEAVYPVSEFLRRGPDDSGIIVNPAYRSSSNMCSSSVTL